MAEKSKTREVIEKSAWAALAIGFLGFAIYGVGIAIKWFINNAPSLGTTTS